MDTDALSKTEECDGALAALGAEACAFGYLTLTVSVLDPSEAGAAAKARAVEAALNAQGLVARIEDLNAVEAWLGSLPGEPYADVRRPLVSTLNLADLLPVSAVWAGPAQDANLQGPPLATARTTGSTPFRLVMQVGDVGHAMVVGPTGSGKSALLSFLALQWFRYSGARVVFFDKGRSARAATLAAGGCWRALEPGARFSLQPLAAIDRDEERAWASEWIAETVRLAGLDPVPRVREEIWVALSALAEAPVGQRTLGERTQRLEGEPKVRRSRPGTGAAAGSPTDRDSALGRTRSAAAPCGAGARDPRCRTRRRRNPWDPGASRADAQSRAAEPGPCFGGSASPSRPSAGSQASRFSGPD